MVMSQSLIHQVNDSIEAGIEYRFQKEITIGSQSLIHQVNDSIDHVKVIQITRFIKVAIPYSSGQ